MRKSGKGYVSNCDVRKSFLPKKGVDGGGGGGGRRDLKCCGPENFSGPTWVFAGPP